MAKRFGRRRRPRVAWFPTFGGALEPEFNATPFPGIEVELDTSGTENGDVLWDAFPLTFDVTEDAIDAQADPVGKSLRDIVQGNEWRLRRIVGKAFVTTVIQAQGATAGTLIDCALGFIVCKTYDDGAPVTDFNEVNPLSQNSMEDPWIWRRRWVLNPHGTVAAGGPFSANLEDSAAYWGFPQDNTKYGSVADGPHIDAKSNRVIHRSERLFGVFALRKYNPQIGSVVAVVEATTRLLLDYRILGSLKGTTYGNRGNMSR